MHLLDNTNGTIRMAYATGEKPWHGLGCEVDPTDPPEVWRRKANMMWENVKIPALYRWRVPLGVRINSLMPEMIMETSFHREL